MQLRAAVVLALALAQPAVALKRVLGSPAGGVTVAPTAADVAKLHAKMEIVAEGLEGILSPEKSGSLASSKIAPALRVFAQELRAALNATAAPKDIPAAMKKLRDAQAGMVDLTKALTTQQAALMREDDDQVMSLLLGVLMTRRNDPPEKQMEVLKSPEFKDLLVSKALLEKHDINTPLFQQVAAYMDEHGSAVASAGSKTQRLAKTVAYFEKRAATLDEEEVRMQRMHDRSSAQLASLIKSSSKEQKEHFEMMKLQADRDYRKRLLAHQRQTKIISDVVTALKQGDVVALNKAEAALRLHMEALKRRRGNFLHLLQLGHRLQRRDCPYCAAQCIDKCHSAGSPYGECLAQCADAGK